MVILRRDVKAPFASFAGGREDGERPHQPEGGRAGRLRGPVQNQEAHPAEQADEGLLREAGALRAGRGACGCASANVGTSACMHARAWVCAHVRVYSCACVCLCMRALPSVALLCPRLQVAPTACPSRPTVRPSPGGGAWWPPPSEVAEVAEAKPVCSSSSSPRWLGHSVGTRPWSQCGFQTVPDPFPRFISRH